MIIYEPQGDYLQLDNWVNSVGHTIPDLKIEWTSSTSLSTKLEAENPGSERGVQTICYQPLLARRQIHRPKLVNKLSKIAWKRLSMVNNFVSHSGAVTICWITNRPSVDKLTNQDNLTVKQAIETLHRGPWLENFKDWILYCALSLTWVTFE